MPNMGPLGDLGQPQSTRPRPLRAQQQQETNDAVFTELDAVQSEETSSSEIIGKYIIDSLPGV